VRWCQEVRQFKPSTVSRHTSVVCGFYRTCVFDGILEHSPAAWLRRPTVPPESPTLGLTQDSASVVTKSPTLPMRPCFQCSPSSRRPFLSVSDVRGPIGRPPPIRPRGASRRRGIRLGVARGHAYCRDSARGALKASRGGEQVAGKSDKVKAAKKNAQRPERLPKRVYERELYRLQAELVKLQEWVRVEGARVVVIFEGRDAAGKGSTIKRVTEYLNPRIARIVALPAPTERQRTQWYFQRYVEQLPAAGEVVLFDRSWYNRAGVERVMGFCTKEEYGRFLHQCPIFERLLVEDGVALRKYWFSVSDAEQEQRFKSRLEDQMRRWKLSPMDLESVSRWESYSRAKDEMFVHTDIPEAPWYVVESEDKRRARINMISHLLSTIPYYEVERPSLELPSRPPSTGYERPPREMQTEVPDHAASLT
jgi:polyphosphate kinase